MDYFFSTKKKHIFWVILDIISKMRFFPKNLAPSVFYPKGILTSWEVSEISYKPFREKRVYLLTYWHADCSEIKIFFRLKARVQ